ncbi:MAG: carboxylesterase family protein [Anaerolineae bacterium]
MGRQIVAETHVGNLGQTVTTFYLQMDFAEVTDVRTITSAGWSLAEAYTDVSRLVPATGISKVSYGEGALTLQVDPFRYLASDWSVTCKSQPSLSFGKAGVTRTLTRTADAFLPGTRNGVAYRLYTPEGPGPHPLVLFLHGGGEGGTDNWLQLVGTLGAAAWTERYPDAMVLAPQNPVPWDVIRASIPAQAGAAPRLPGWSTDTLAVVASLVRGLIAGGRADPAKVVVTGMSMGGAGTLRMLAHHGELFAGAAPICPSMNEETLPYLKGLVEMPVWISSAYRDTFPTRHLQIVEGIEHLQAAGNRNAHYTLYTAEELAAYGLGCHPGLTDEQRWGENHHSWVLTLNNAYGIMDWLMAQRRG